MTSGHLCLEKVALEPSPMFRMASLNSVVMNKKEVPVFGKINFLQPQDSRQYLFSLTPRNDLRTNYKQLRGATNIGLKTICQRTFFTCFIKDVTVKVRICLNLTNL